MATKNFLIEVEEGDTICKSCTYKIENAACAVCNCPFGMKVSQPPHNEDKRIGGRKMKAEDWIKIERDKDGFIDEQSKELLYNSLPVIIWDSKYKELENIREDNWYDWLHDLEKPRYSHYLPIVPPKED